jgi:flagellar motor switch protein FliM
MPTSARRKPTGTVQEPRSASPRDFRSPRRLSAARVLELSTALENALPALERRLSETLGVRGELALEKLGEVDAGTLLDALAEPLVVLRFKVNGQPAWLVWEPASAVLVLESLLGSRADEAKARKLSAAETKIAATLLGEVARAACAALGFAAADLALVQTVPELGSWKDGGEGKEAHRLAVELALRRGDRAGALTLYLPGISGEGAEAPALPAALPAHLDAVEVELAARLEGCEIPLDQLLSLEQGDVIPLEARVSDPTRLCVEGLTLAFGRLGTKGGRLAVRIERIAALAERAA